MKQPNTYRLSLGLAILALGVATATVRANQEAGVGETVAKEAVASFVDVADATVDGPLPDTKGAYYVVQGVAFTSRVDATSGEVRSLTRLDVSPSDGKPALDETDALAASNDFLVAHDIDTSGMTLTGGIQDDGGFSEFLFVWQRWVDGVRVPDSRVVALNPETGAVFQYLDYHRNYEPPRQAKVTEAEAIEGAISKVASGRESSIVASDLAITFDKAGTQSLSWEVQLTAPNPEGWTDAYVVLVDALSGDATIVGHG